MSRSWSCKRLQAAICPNFSPPHQESEVNTTLDITQDHAMLTHSLALVPTLPYGMFYQHPC